MTARFGRVITAMVTPFDDNGELDLDAAAELAQFLVETGSDGLVLAGTTGESPVLTDSEALARFGGYRGRLSNALARAREGGVDWVTRPVIDSYHTVWFELHEDLLATLGRTRSAERGTRGAERARRHGASTTGRTRQGERR